MAHMQYLPCSVTPQVQVSRDKCYSRFGREQIQQRWPRVFRVRKPWSRGHEQVLVFAGHKSDHAAREQCPRSTAWVEWSFGFHHDSHDEIVNAAKAIRCDRCMVVHRQGVRARVRDDFDGQVQLPRQVDLMDQQCQSRTDQCCWSSFLRRTSAL